MRDWLKELDDLDRDCVLQYEFLLGRHLNSIEEYREIDGQVDDMVLDWNTRKKFFDEYPGLKKYANERMLSNLDNLKYRYLVVVHNEDGVRYLPSNSRNAVQHIEKNKADVCWVYDKDGYWLSFTKRDEKTGEVYRPRMFPDGEPRKRFAELLEVFSDRKACFYKLEELKSNANYFLGSGRKDKSLLVSHDAGEHISMMKSLWLGLDDKGREASLTWEQILDYERELKKAPVRDSLENIIQEAADSVKTSCDDREPHRKDIDFEI